jgi:hypothetical protein
VDQDAPSGCCLDEIEHQIGQQKRTEVIGRKGPFDAVDSKPALGEDAGGVVDEDVDGGETSTDVVGKRPIAMTCPRAAVRAPLPLRPAPRPPGR